MRKKERIAFIGTAKSAKLGPVTKALVESELYGTPLSPVMLEAAKKLGYVK